MNRLGILIISLFCSFLICVACEAGTCPSAAGSPLQGPSADLVKSLVQDPLLSGGVAAVGFSADGQALRSLRGELSEPLSGDPVESARTFILEHRNLFNVPSDMEAATLVAIRNDVVDGVRHLAFGLELNGRQLHQTMIDLHIGRDRRIHFVTGSFPTISDLRRGTEISVEAALKLAHKAIDFKRSRGEVSIDRVLTVRETVIVPAYFIRIPAAEPLGDFAILLDGLDGTVLDVENELKFFNRNPGRGSVYKIHPNLSPLTIEPLPHLLNDTLKGRFVDVLNEDAPPASSPTQEFIYAPEDTHFDEVNAYYHINRVHDFFSAMGYTKLDRPLKVMVHNETKYDSAFYSPKNDIICLGDGNRCNDFAKEDSIFYHEYAHAVLQQIIVLNYKDESGALNEGQADYFACSLSNDSKVGDYVESKTYPSCIRNIDNKTHYPESNYGGVHIACFVWGASLWDLRKALGPQAADRLIFKSHYYLKTADCKFYDGYQAILAADRDLNGSANAKLITRIFTDRGIAGEAVRRTTLDAGDLARIRAFLVAHHELN